MGCKRTDCQYYSNYTNTCDYTLIMYELRKCSIEQCTKYKKKDKDRHPESLFESEYNEYYGDTL